MPVLGLYPRQVMSSSPLCYGYAFSAFFAFAPLSFFSGVSFFSLWESMIALALATASLFRSARYEFFAVWFAIPLYVLNGDLN